MGINYPNELYELCIGFGTMKFMVSRVLSHVCMYVYMSVCIYLLIQSHFANLITNRDFILCGTVRPALPVKSNLEIIQDCQEIVNKFVILLI